MSLSRIQTRDDLLHLVPRHTSFVGIDSDGCIFPTMEIKQKQCFHGLIASTWHLESIEPLVRETAEFVNLHSVHRGQNRFPCLLKTFELLHERPDVAASGVVLPPLTPLREYCNSGLALGNPSLEACVRDTGDAELARVLEWSLAVNARIAALVKNIAPFRWVMESLGDIRAHSDAICVSQTPTEALMREWADAGILDYVSGIAGQELGSKAEHLTLATRGRYAAGRVLMIGDAPGDLKAARNAGARFYPIDPGGEGDSWRRFHEEAYALFLEDRYSAEYEAALIAQFQALLPETPPWILNSSLKGTPS